MRSDTRPGSALTATARSGAPSPLKSPTADDGEVASTEPPKARARAARTSAGSAAEKSGSTTAGRRCSIAAGEGTTERSATGRRVQARGRMAAASTARAARMGVRAWALVMVAPWEEGDRPEGGRPPYRPQSELRNVMSWFFCVVLRLR